MWTTGLLHHSAPLLLILLALVSYLGTLTNAFVNNMKPNPVPIVPKSPPGTRFKDLPYPYVGTSVTSVLFTMKPSPDTIYDGHAKDNIRVDIAGQGPVLWSVSRWNQGDLSPRLDPRHPYAQTNLNDFPGHDGFTAEGPKDPSAQAWRPDIEKGVMLATVAQNGQKWEDESPHFYATAACVTDSSGYGYSMKTGQFGNNNPNIDVTLGKAGSKGEANIDVAVAWFPYSQGWTGGYIDAPPEYNHNSQPKWMTPDSHSPDLPTDLSDHKLVKWSERAARLRLPGVKPYTDGMLFLTSTDPGKSNNDLNIMGCYTKNWGKGWRIQAREDSQEDPTKLVESSEHMFAFLYVPFSTTGLIGGHVDLTGSVVHGAGNFKVTKLDQGTYSIEIGGEPKSQSDGVLILQVTGRDDNNRKFAKHAFLSYNYSSSGSLIVEAHLLHYVKNAAGVLEEVFPLIDADFYFMWLDFKHPPTPERDMFTGRLPEASSSAPYWLGFLLGLVLGGVGLISFILLASPYLGISRISWQNPFSKPQPLIPTEIAEEELLMGPYAPAEEPKP